MPIQAIRMMGQAVRSTIPVHTTFQESVLFPPPVDLRATPLVGMSFAPSMQSEPPILDTENRLKLLITPTVIHLRINEMAEEILADWIRHHPKIKTLVVLTLLKGAKPFSTELVAALKTKISEKRLPFQIREDAMRVSSYYGSQSSGEIQVKRQPRYNLANQAVLVVEDIVDTGHTLNRVLNELRMRGVLPSYLKVVALLDKPTGRKPQFVDYHAEFTGFIIPPHFVVGFGLDLDDDYRQRAGIAYFPDPTRAIREKQLKLTDIGYLYFYPLPNGTKKKKC